MTAENFNTRTLVRVLISWMNRERVAPTRTRVVKFLYLADLQFARYHKGRTLTGWTWYVDSFGPVAVEALRLLDEGIKEEWLSAKVLSDAKGEEDIPAADLQIERRRRTTIYGLPDLHWRLVGFLSSDVRDEEEALPLGLAKLKSWIVKYGSDTNALLRFVYGNTEPMEVATEGAPLDFSRARPVVNAKAIEGSRLTKADKGRIADILSRMKKKYDSAAKRSATMVQAPYDATYFEQLPAEDEDISGDLILTFSKKE